MIRFPRPLAAIALATLSFPFPLPAQTPDKAETEIARPSPAERNAEANAALPADQAAMKAHVMFLASDAMRGRDAASEEYAIAAQYVASQFYAAGLRPAGDEGSYLQRVRLISYRPADKGTFVISRAGKDPQPLEFGEDYLPGADPAAAITTVDAPVVFVGWGIVAPQYKVDDYKGVDVRGRIVAYFNGAPSSFGGEERAHFGSRETKVATAAAHGAVGVLTLSPPSESVEEFAKMAGGYDRPGVTWASLDGTGNNPYPATPRLGTLSAQGAAKLFAGARTPWDKIARIAASKNPRYRPVPLPGKLTVALKTASELQESANVAGLLPGSDPKLKDQVVVLSAHLDHVGVGKAVKGDTIYNGAMDNAVGIASLIEEAKRFKASGKPPRRSILFLAVTAEEKGLVGSDYFARHPTIAKDRLVADVNLDMPIITYPFEDVIAFGADRSTLGPIVHKTAADMGLTFSPDPMPEMGLFVRSDHYRFVQQGIPSVFLWPGEAGPGKAAVEAFFAQHYHKPSDEVVQAPGIDWASGVRFIDANYAIARAIADADARPSWNKGDFFGTLYHGYGAQ